ncbi:MAG TPA: hemerythrin domain-containing protein [Flavisolibacter sp.]
MNKDQVLSIGIPASLKSEHEELHEKLKKYTKLPGKTGAAAKEVARLLHPHFIKEEKYAMPPLGLLADLARDETAIDMADKKEAIAMSEKLQEDFAEMLAEHEEIVKALQELHQAAKAENHPEVMRFTEALKLHAKTEEEVLYPAAILVGLYLKQRL